MSPQNGYRYFRKQKLNFSQPVIAARMSQYVVVTVPTELSRLSILYNLQVMSANWIKEKTNKMHKLILD